MYDVTFLVKETHKKVTKSFSSPYLCMNFIRKCRYSKKVELVSYPNLS